MKKIVIGFCAALIALVAIGLSGQTTKASSRGETVTLDLVVNTYENVKSGAVNLSYDSSVLEIVSGQMKVGSTFDSFTPGTGKGVMGAMSGTFTVTGNILSVTFKIKDDAPFTSTTVTAAVTIRPDGAAQIDDNYTMGTVTVTCTHNWGAWTKENDNQHCRTCSICSEVQHADHTWNNGEVTTAATCNATGLKTYTCTVCSATKTETILATGNHTYGDWVKVDDDTHKHTCTGCDAFETQAHTWNNGQETTPATCNATGVKTYTCTACGATKTEPISATGVHTYGEWVKVDENTHKHTCTVCGQASETKDHTWNAGVESSAATCVADGVKTYTCTACGATKTEPIPATGVHTYGDWVKVDDDTHKRTCTVCGEASETESHAWNAEWSKDGTSHYHLCPTCGAKKDEAAHTPGPAATETTPQTCTICGYIITPALAHTHTWSTDWTNDENEHWHTCPGCNEKGDAAAHEFDNDCDPDCNVCGYTRTIEHKFEYKYDETGHWKECTVCGLKEEKEDHVPGKEATETEAQVCLVCGYEIAPATGSETEAETEAESEAETKGEGETKAPEKGGETAKPTNNNGWILPVVLGVVLVAGAVGAFFFVTKKKKKK